MFSPLHFACSCTHTHTHTDNSGICRNTTMNMLMFLSDNLLQWLPNNTNQLYQHSALCMPFWCLIRSLLTECLITYFTWIWKFTPMFSHTTLVTVCPVTHITNLKALTTMYALKFPQTTLGIVCLITHITKREGAHHYVCVDVFSNSSDHWTPY